MINHKEILTPFNAHNYRIKTGSSYLISLRKHDIGFEKVKRKNATKISGLHELIHALYCIMEDYNFAAFETPVTKYIQLEIEYCNRFGYFKTIKANEWIDLENLMNTIDSFPQLVLDDISPFVQHNVFKAILSKKAQAFNHLVVDTNSNNVSKQLTSAGIRHHKCGATTPSFSIGTTYNLYVLHSEEDANLGILTCFSKGAKCIDLVPIRKAFLDCFKQ